MQAENYWSSSGSVVFHYNLELTGPGGLPAPILGLELFHCAVECIAGLHVMTNKVYLFKFGQVLDASDDATIMVAEETKCKSISNSLLKHLPS